MHRVISPRNTYSVVYIEYDEWCNENIQIPYLMEGDNMAITLNNSASVTYNFAGLTDWASSNIATTNLVEDYSLMAVKQSNNSSWRPDNLPEKLTVESIRSKTNGTVTLFDAAGYSLDATN